jgi:hypothetical protein
MSFEIPRHLSPHRQALLREAFSFMEESQGDNLLGVVLMGSAARERETAYSDLDVIAVLDHDAPDANWPHRTDLELIPVTLAHLETVAPFGSPEWGNRWANAWIPVLLDRTGGRIQAAIDRQHWLSVEEINHLLLDGDRLDGWINLLYRALKSARIGNTLEARLDGAESVPYLLDVVFALHGLVRPYNAYLRWALDRHPLPGWPAVDLLDIVQRTMTGDADAMRESYARVVADCLAFDRAHDQTRLQDLIATWDGESYDVLRG